MSHPCEQQTSTVSGRETDVDAGLDPQPCGTNPAVAAGSAATENQATIRLENTVSNEERERKSSCCKQKRNQS